VALPSFDDEAAHWPDRTPQDTVRRLASLGVREVAVKDGARPVLVHADGRDATRATPPVEGIRDTTGAGDAFNAGYLGARLVGRSPGEAVAAGQRLSALVIRNLGARAPKEAVQAQGRNLRR
jgi:2-dehydro-3-deoxygluconokinase